MGLLDDAIREHLELKRLSGVDPGEVAREEKDALGPVPREKAEESEGHEDSPAEASPDLSGSFFPESELPPAMDSAVASHVGQETVEINMDAELAEEVDFEHKREDREPTEGVRVEPAGHPAHTRADPEESLEWETPGDADTDEDSKGGEPVEDVLEETPDFLRDTPEQ
ncbi:MAG TPA: hypothetical protein VIJ33_03020, partial [Solirubrobacteraceae bacterium]